MKIGIDIRLIGKKQTGSEAVFFNLVKNLAVIDAANEYKLFTDITDEETLAKIKKDLGIEKKNNFEIIPLATANKFIWNFWTLQRHLRRQRVDVYLTQYITPFFVPKKIKIATIIHDVSFVVYKRFIKFSDLFFLSLLIPLSLRRADKIIAVSKFTRLEIAKYYRTNLGKIDWIHNAVSDDFLKADISVEKQNRVKKKYSLPEKFILYIGTLQPRKNIPVLVEAYEKIKKDVGDIKLVIAGGKSHNFDQKIDETVRKYNLENDVIFPGFIDEEDKAAMMKMAQLFCFPSFYEGFGIPVLEAMTIGTPVVASYILPHREIAGNAVSFFDPDSPEELAEKIIEATSNEEKRKMLIQKGYEQAKKFSWAATARKTLDIFSNMG